uniref:WSCD family member AAEL009094 n=1 Tax=Cacopsylla melanoneura TaxID=428564 RepID=A0A8D8YQ98_9HEMI
MYKVRLFTLCVIISVYLIGVILLSTVSLNDSRKITLGGAGVRNRGMGMSGAALGRTPKYDIEWCQPLHFIQSPGNRPVVGLVSFPGSGNTWLRYLLQQATGIHTGSVYMDYGLFKNGFPGEMITNASVSVVKTHEWGPFTRSKFDKAVLLIRSPGDSIVAEFNRRSGGHIGFASVDRYTRANGKYWRQFFYDKLRAWREMTLDWLHNFSGPLHIITYEDLVSNLPHTLISILHFIDLPAGNLTCAIQRREGIFRRRKRKTKLQPFTKDMKIQLDFVWNNVFVEINNLIDQNSSSYM